MIDYHVHTQLCDHAEGTAEAYIRQAIDIGLKEICFLDHLTLRPLEKNLSMRPSEVSIYFQALQVLKRQYAGKIKVKIGLEIDHNPEHIDYFCEIVARHPFDVIGGSLHFPGGINIVSSKSAWKHGDLDPGKVYPLYLEQLEKMLDYDYFDVVCHLDMVKKFAWRPADTWDSQMDRILKIIQQKKLCVEVNSSGYNHPVKETYPSADIIRKCSEYDIDLTLGSDAHRPTSVGQHYNKVFDLLLAAGYRHLTVFNRRKPEKITIEAYSTGSR